MRVLSFVLAMALAGPAAPQFTNPDAEAHFVRANERYAEADFAGASESLRLAYELEPLPKLLYSRAQVERRQENWVAAAELYQAYLDTDPPEEGTVHARRHLLFCQAQAARQDERCEEAIELFDLFMAEHDDDKEIEEARAGIDACAEILAAKADSEARAQPETESPPPPPEVDRDPLPAPWYRSVTGGVLAGVGVAGAATGVTLLGLAYRDQRLAEDEPTHDGSVLRYERARSREIAGAITLAFAGSALILSGLAYGIAARRGRERGEGRVSLTPVGLRARF